LSIRRRFQAVGGELVDCLKQEEATVLSSAHETLINQRLQRVDVGIDHTLRRVEIETPRKDRKPCKQISLLKSQELDAPLTRRSQRPLPLRLVQSAAREQIEAAAETIQNLPRG